MDAMQPLMVASGLAVGGGLLGAALFSLAQRRRLHRETSRVATLLATADSLPSLRGAVSKLASRMATTWMHNAGRWRQRWSG